MCPRSIGNTIGTGCRSQHLAASFHGCHDNIKRYFKTDLPWIPVGFEDTKCGSVAGVGYVRIVRLLCFVIAAYLADVSRMCFLYSDTGGTGTIVTIFCDSIVGIVIYMGYFYRVAVDMVTGCNICIIFIELIFDCADISRGVIFVRTLPVIGMFAVCVELVYLKELLLKDWEVCTWIMDEQSEYLGMQLYPLIFKAENKMRAFINKVMTHNFGIKWMELRGLEDMCRGKSYL